ncbi:glycosyltransferase [Gottfriedia acidiceleris]|uniref:CgeB family protein n=1 Tax=Gottfriedia acidiceleris TaxID=371036 RepID=UPI002F2659C4
MLKESIEKQITRLRNEKFDTKMMLQKLMNVDEPFYFRNHELISFSADDFRINKGVQKFQKEKEVLFNNKLVRQTAVIDYIDETKLKDLLFNEGRRKLFTRFGVTGFVSGKSEVVCELRLVDHENNSSTLSFQIDEVIDLSEFSQKEIQSVSFSIYMTGAATLHLFHAKLMGSYKKTESEKIHLMKQKKEIKDFRVGFIADEFTTRCFDYEFQLVKVTPENWLDEFQKHRIDFFFCESAWLGNEGAWKDKIGTKNHRNHTKLLKLVYWCKEHYIPTVFWNKEDPFHYQAFIDTAKHFDYVFTTDFESVQNYVAEGCENVYCLPFAAQPKIHNPIEYLPRKEKVVFAGAYYGKKFPERTNAMEKLVNASKEYGLDIYDRNYHNPTSPNQFPDEYKPFIVGNLKQNEIDIAYKGYKVALNVNSITKSPTMFARRVFELLASNTPIISSHSEGIHRMFGDIVTATDNEKLMKERLSNYYSDETFYKKNRLLTLRKVLEEHTYTNRVEDLLNIINLPYEMNEETATLVGIVRSNSDYEKLMEIYSRQGIKRKKLVILLDLFDGYLNIFNQNNHGDIKTYLIDYCHHYFSLNDLVDSYYIAPINLDHYYGENYVRDLMLATKYTNDTIISKGNGNSYNYVNGCHIDEALICKKATRFIRPSEFISLLDNKSTIGHFSKAGVQFFEIDEFNFYRDACVQAISQDKIESILV